MPDSQVANSEGSWLMLQTVTTPIAYIIKLLGGSIHITNGSGRQAVSVVSTLKYYRDRSPIKGSTVAQALPVLVSRVKAGGCRNPRDKADKNGCEMDHSFEVPDDVPCNAFDSYLWEIAELLWLAGSREELPAVGLGRGAQFALWVSHNTALGSKYDVRLGTEGGLIRYEPIPIFGNPDVITASADTPEEALDVCVDALRIKVQKQLSLEGLIAQFKERHSGGLESGPFMVIRRNNTFSMNWKLGGDWYCSTGEDRHQAVINSLAGSLTCASDAGLGCTLKPNHPGKHQPPENIRHRASAV